MDACVGGCWCASHAPLALACASIFNSISGARALRYETSINQLPTAWRSFWSVNFCWPRCSSSSEELIPRRLIELEGCGLSLTVGAQAFFDPKILAEGRFPFFSFLLFLSLSVLLLAFLATGNWSGDATAPGCGFFYFNYWAQLASKSAVRKCSVDSPLRSDWIELKCKNDLLLAWMEQWRPICDTFTSMCEKSSSILWNLKTHSFF
jgi:hypothetical protein